MLSSPTMPGTGYPVLALHLHHGTLGVARSLGRLGVPVYGMGDDPDGAVSGSRYFREVFPWNFGSASDRETTEALLRVGKRIGEPVILIAGTDDLALLLARRADELEHRFLFPRLPPSVVSSMIDKARLYRLALTHGIPTPGAAFPTSASEAEEMASNFRFPVMLKGIDGLRLQARRGVKMTRTDTPTEMVAAFRRLHDPAAPNLMLQEYIPGGDDTVWMFNGYFDQESRCLFGLTGQKIHQFPPHRGATSLGVLRENPRVRALTLRFAEAIGYRGILDIGFRYDARDDTYKLLDPNPRIGSTFRLFVDRRGLDVARALYLDLNGRPVPPTEPVEGRKWAVEDWEIESLRGYLRTGALTASDWLRDLKGVRETAWWAPDDPRPAFRRGTAVASRLFRGAARGVGRTLRESLRLLPFLSNGRGESQGKPAPDEEKDPDHRHPGAGRHVHTPVDRSDPSPGLRRPPSLTPGDDESVLEAGVERSATSGAA